MALRVMIVDPEPFFCESLAVALGGRGLSVVGWATAERQALDLVDQRSPDVVFTEVGLAGGSGLALARKLRGRTRVIVLTRRPEEEVLLDAADSGAAGCLSHDLGLARLLSLLKGPADGFLVDPAALLRALRRIAADRREKGRERTTLAKLTRREREILSLIAKGLDDQRIADRLYLSANTVRTHAGNILRKLPARSRAEAARIYVGAVGEGGRVLRIEGPSLGRS